MQIQILLIVLIIWCVYFLFSPRSILKSLAVISCHVSWAPSFQSLAWPWYFREIRDSYFVTHFGSVWCLQFRSWAEITVWYRSKWKYSRFYYIHNVSFSIDSTRMCSGLVYFKKNTKWSSEYSWFSTYLVARNSHGTRFTTDSIMWPTGWE